MSYAVWGLNTNVAASLNGEHDILLHTKQN
jgi:hypothetical protein